MASKAEIALRIVNLSLSSIIPHVLDLLAKRKTLTRMVESGEDPNDADWAAVDADLAAVVAELREELLPEEEGTPAKEPSEGQGAAGPP